MTISAREEHARLTPGMVAAIRRAERDADTGKWILSPPVHTSTVKALIDRQLVNHWYALTGLGEAVRAIELNKEDTMSKQYRCSGSGKTPSATEVKSVRGSGGVVRQQERGVCPDNGNHQDLPIRGGAVQDHSG